MHGRAYISCAGVALSLFLLLSPVAPQAQGSGGQPAQPGQQGGLPALAARVEAIDAALRQLRLDVAAEAAARAAADATLQNDLANEAAMRAALQARIAALGDEMTALQQLFASLNPAVNAAQQDIADLRADLDALADTIAGLGGGLTSYDQLGGLPCTNTRGQASKVYLVGTLRTPVCALTSLSGRFHDVGPAIVDTLTNLMWERKTTAIGSGTSTTDLHDVDNFYNWSSATGTWIAGVNAEGFAGFSDWRVPTKDELVTLVDTSVPKCGYFPLPGCIDPFFGPSRSTYWSSTEVDAGSAWIVFFTIDPPGSMPKAIANSVRAVRTGP